VPPRSPEVIYMLVNFVFINLYAYTI